MKKNFLKKVCVAAMAVVMTVGSAMSAMAAEYDAFLKYGDGGYWPINTYNNSETDKFIPESAMKKVSGPGTYTLSIVYSEVEAAGQQTWGSASTGVSESEIIIYGAGDEFKDYKVSDLKMIYDDVDADVDMTKISTYVYDKNSDGVDDFGIFIYNKYDTEWSLLNPPIAVDTVTFSEKLDVTFTLVDPNAQPESSQPESSESESSSEAGGSGSGSGSNSGSGSGSGESGTPSTGDSSMVAAFVALAAVSALVVLKKRTVNE